MRFCNSRSSCLFLCDWAALNTFSSPQCSPWWCHYFCRLIQIQEKLFPLCWYWTSPSTSSRLITSLQKTMLEGQNMVSQFCKVQAHTLAIKCLEEIVWSSWNLSCIQWSKYSFHIFQKVISFRLQFNLTGTNVVLSNFWTIPSLLISRCSTHLPMVSHKVHHDFCLFREVLFSATFLFMSNYKMFLVLFLVKPCLFISEIREFFLQAPRAYFLTWPLYEILIWLFELVYPNS